MNVSVGSSLQGIEETVVVQGSAWVLHCQTMKSALLFAGLYFIHLLVAPAMYQWQNQERQYQKQLQN